MEISSLSLEKQGSMKRKHFEGLLNLEKRIDFDANQ